VDQAIRETEATVAKHERIKTGLMQTLLTNGIDKQGTVRSQETHAFKDSPCGKVPIDWHVKSLAECVRADSPICYGILMPGAFYENGVPVIKVRDIINGAIVQSDILLTDPKIDKLYRRSRLRSEDLLITIRGTTGRIAVVPKELDGANITQDTARVRLKQEHSVQFFYFILQSKLVQNQISLHTIGQAVKGINIADVKNIAIALPEKDEQIAIGQRLSACHRNLTETKSLYAKLRLISRGLMQDLLTGKTRVTALLEPKPDRDKLYA
jgi:type I restriction enzyme, S subunit